MAGHEFETCGYISVTSYCNNDCVFCGLKEYGIRYQIPLHEVQEQLKLIRQHGAKRIVFTGGEPTIHPEIAQIIESAAKAGYGHIGVFTNGRNIKNSAFIKTLMDAGLDSAMVSLHGMNSETHDETVRSKGAHEQTMHGLRVLSDAGVNLVINTPITSLNLGEIVPMYDFISAFGDSVRRWQLSNLFPTAVVMSRPDLHPDYESIQEAIFEVLMRSQTGPLKCVTQEIPLCIVFPWLDETRDLSDERKQMICRRDIEGDYRQYRPWTSPYKTMLPTCAPCGMRSRCNGIPLCYLMSHRDLSIFRPLEYLSDESWRRQMGIAG
jgi:sulfatase maturation enzyme AslB (radical SAM superfamily)